MSKDAPNHLHSKVTFAGLLITLGIIYGDIGTSPLYVLKSLIGDKAISSVTVMGGLSCIFWTLTLQTTIKYVILTLRADNNGEGGIFALYTLVRRTKKKWLLIPAIVGGSMLLADGIITPPISVSSAIEGLRVFRPNINTIPIVIGIIAALFIIQQFGTRFVGRSFGPVMFVWFGMLAFLGVMMISKNPAILLALNPYYAYDLLTHHPGSLALLGAVFLCTTGAEALYSDLGHCGRKNVRTTWIFVKTALVLNYFGQGAWLISATNLGHKLGKDDNPFFLIMPHWFYGTGIVIATAAAIIASQALISGSFTLVNEAIRLNFWPKVRIKYPTDFRGQLYIPSVNWLLLMGCIGVVLFFKESANMEAAYGLAIVITMLMTTLLLSYYLLLRRAPAWKIMLLLFVYLSIELLFLTAIAVEKFSHGGYITLLIGIVLISVMWIWYDARKIRNRYVEFVKLDEYLPVIAELGQDSSIPKFATHLVYLTSADIKDEIESKIIYSILQKRPKRADVYWFAHVHVTDQPYTLEYKVTELVNKEVFRIDFFLGFRVPTRINKMFRQVVTEMVQNHEVDITSRYESLNKANVIGDFRFVVLEKYLSADNELPIYEKIILDIYYVMKPITLSEESAFGLDTSSVTVEKVPIVISPPKQMNLKRIS
ncbi:MAG TPA: KUP/HAK/KT family potassium transporter [Bacteroidia bacterium]|jgi:KUP system potassium uptake protein|nr:KUP/HAK/KT family potassium transporter [Bacteroidia bacterium]